MASDIIKFNGYHLIAHTAFNVTGLELVRSFLVNKGLLGRDPTRYGGYSYGNISEKRNNKIIISGTQTSHLPHLDSDGYVRILAYNLQNGNIYSAGVVKPSSESLTHLAIYEQDENIKAVIHVHCPKLWARENVIRTNDVAEYGTLEMVNEVKRLFQETDVRNKKIFAMGGHQDGIIAFGKDCITALEIVMTYID